MQTLWSRVAQVRATCRCPQCLNTANGVTRRATASATKRTPRYLYSSTLWYSGIFAAAATFDAARKERRKEQWDRVIAEVRQELEQPTSLRDVKAVGAEGKLDDTVKADDAVVAGKENIDGDVKEYKPFGALLERDETTNARQDVADETIGSDTLDNKENENCIFDLLDTAKSRPQWPESTGPRLGQDRSDFPEFNLPPQSVYAADWAKERAKIRRWTPKKLATVQKCSELLQWQFISRIQWCGSVDQAVAAVPEEYAKHILQSRDSMMREYKIKMAELQEIKAADHQLSDYHPRNPEQGQSFCQYTQDSLGRFHDTARQVNRSLRSLFEQRRLESISQSALLAKLAYTLHLSPAPPNVDTFNTLLVGLINVGEDHLAKKVVVNMSESHIRANEVSLVAELEYHTRRDDIQKFVRLVERLRGKHGGPMLAQPNIRITRGSRKKTLFRWEVEGRRGREERVIQLPAPTPMVFGAIINGVLKFAGFESALSIVEEMGREGWGLCMAGLTPLLKDCTLRNDFTSGLAVWKQIQALKIKSVGQRVVHAEIGIEAYAAMLRLCTACDQQETFNSVWSQAMRTWERSIDKLVRLVKEPYDVEKEQSDTGPKPLSVFKRPKIRKKQSVVWPVLAQSVEEPVVHDKNNDNLCWQQSGQSPADQEVEVEEEQHHELDTGTMTYSVSFGQTEEQFEQTQSAAIVQQKTAIASSTVFRPYNGNSPRQSSMSLSEQQLLGTHPASHELDDYELVERPMSAQA